MKTIARIMILSGIAIIGIASASQCARANGFHVERIEVGPATVPGIVDTPVAGYSNTAPRLMRRTQGPAVIELWEVAPANGCHHGFRDAHTGACF